MRLKVYAENLFTRIMGQLAEPQSWDNDTVEGGLRCTEYKLAKP